MAPTPFDLGRCFVDLFLAARGGDDIGSSIGEAEAQDSPNPRRASDYNCGLVFEVKDDRGHYCFIFIIYRSRPTALTLDLE